ncbi:MAG TPA: hypothetical protein VHU14_01680 [Solirubrobacterales bacterium]|jgi:hypothetical protein|nr:hypothetical protein [Solirubrobacterales bacterium]
MTTAALSYAIDEHDHLIRVDEGYYRFAEENGWSEAGSSLGRSLWDYVAGREVVKLQRLLVRRVRDEVGDVELPFRCDGPGVRREMNIRIVARPGGRVVLFSARLRSEEARDLLQPLLDPNAPRGSDPLEMCGWCDRFEVSGEWVEVEQAAKRLELFNKPELPELSHGICPDCHQMLLAA